MERPRGSVEVSSVEEGQRLDSLVSSLSGVSRSKVQRLISAGHVLVDGAPARKNHSVSPGERVSWDAPPPEPEDLESQDIALDVIYEDEHLVVVDKPARVVMYPGPGHESSTLLNALLGRYPGIAGVGGKGRPGIFHRLDRDTSGLVAVALTEGAYQAMVKEMKERRVTREYLALVVGSIAAETGTIDLPMGRSRANRKRMAVDRVAGRRAVSRFKVRERFDDRFTLVEVALETGRTHQIRVHFSHIGHPVAGDPEYSRGRASRQLGLDRQFLHAWRLAFDHPFTGERLEFESGLPAELQQALEKIQVKGQTP